MHVRPADFLRCGVSDSALRWANVTEGESCAVENVAYIAYGTNQEFIDVVSR